MRCSARCSQEKCPGFTARFIEPPACWVFDPRPDAPDSIVSRSPSTPFGALRVNAKNAASIDVHPAGAGNSERPFARP
jgi:hypothetical protein